MKPPQRVLSPDDTTPEPIHVDPPRDTLPCPPPVISVPPVVVPRPPFKTYPSPPASPPASGPAMVIDLTSEDLEDDD